MSVYSLKSSVLFQDWARTSKSNAPQSIPAAALIPVLQKWVENTGDRGLCLLGQQWTGTEGIPGWFSGWWAPPAPSDRAPRWAAECSHNSCSPRPASPATQTQQNSAEWAQPVLRTAPQAVSKYRKRALWGEKRGKKLRKFRRGRGKKLDDKFKSAMTCFAPLWPC